jgi:hypothetical protein
MTADFDLPGYEDVELIGAGGFGRVFRARQPAFDRTVAVKLLNGRLDDEATLRRFRRECQALGAVAGHPNIVPVYDAGGTPAGQPYLVMDYVRGGSLADRLQRTGPLPWTEVASIGVRLAGALHTAHAAGVLHRDIKPENILASGYGEPQLADFGIAQRAGVENRTTTAAAMTPSHTAPEQFSGGPPTTATDVYSLASTLYTLLAGASPFQGRPEESVFALIARAATEPTPDLRPRGVPEALAAVIDAGLAKQPAMRPSSALEFGRLLQEAQQLLHTPVTSLPVAQDASPAARGAEGVWGLPPQITPSADATRPRFAPPLPQSPPPAPQPRPRRLWLVVAGVVAVVLAGLGAVLGYALISHLAASGPPAPVSPQGSSPGTVPGTAPTTAGSGATPVSSGSEPEAAGAAGSGAPAADGTLNTQLLRTGQPPLEGWSDGGDLGQIITPDTAFFCRRTIDLAQGPQASALFTGPDSRVLDQHVYRVGAQRAAAAMSALRASASCGSWTGELSSDAMRVTKGAAVSVGDDAAAYLVASSLAQTYQVFFRLGGDVCVITVGAIGGTVTAADRDLAAQAAAAAAKKLAAG